MHKETAKELLQQLAERKLNEIIVKKEEFLDFRKELIAREDFKHFQGTAKHGGETIYTYLDEPRS